MKTLQVMMGDDVVGIVRTRPQDGQPTFTYGEHWLNTNADFPLSLSMPVGPETYGPDETYPFLAGILPESDATLSTIARTHHVSAGNPVSILSVIGEDCPGALRFIPSGRTGEDFLRILEHGRDILWQNEDEMERRLAYLRKDRRATGRIAGDPGYFSLAGAQPKMAVYERDGKIGIPGSLVPTTTILKPPMAGLEGQLYNEHFCLSLARELGLPAVDSKVVHFGSESAISIARYDRHMLEDGTVVRLHQEDMCQALSIMPGNKYQYLEGPGVAGIVRKVLSRSTHAGDDRTFLRAVMLNTAIGGTDAHGKNYSVLLGPGKVALAPLYDINSLLPYPEFSRKSKMSMSIGGHYVVESIKPRHWVREAEKAGVDVDRTMADYAELIQALPDAVSSVMKGLRSDGLVDPSLDLLADKIQERATKMRFDLEVHRPSGPGMQPS